MAKYCPKCGSQVDDTAAFCGACGTSFVAGGANMNYQQPNMQQPMNNNMNYGGGRPVVTNRNIVTAIILSLVTCGIYGLYWFVMLTEDANRVSGDNKTSGGMALLLTLVTCGIYGFYWYWKQGQKLYQASQTYGTGSQDNSVLYLILGIFGLGIVSYCMMQSELNKYSN